MPHLNGNGYIVMMFGLEDEIKKWSRVHGVEATLFLQATGLDDLWESNEEQMLWTARLHPIVKKVDVAKLFSWIQTLQETHKVNHDAIKYFKECNRLSLKQVRRLSDARAEWKSRYILEEHIIPLHNILWNRRHAELNIGSESLITTVATLSEICQKAMVSTRYDVCQQSLMVASAFLADRVKSDQTISPLPNNLKMLLTKLQNKEDREEACKRILQECQDYVKLSRFAESSLVFEQAAFAITELCTCGDSVPTFPRYSPTPSYMWTVATAPARIDLAGGWSDTPPICFQYGGAVVGLAVNVDNRKPLSCRCRTILGGAGILLRTESRDLKSGSLLDYAESN
eukprot:CAMPEP_0194198258 /NCGR_PEP_ID=MMETSP0154-20130528/77664_1 /TAXON_ID=1049557 /ORGANISM="Thalassiothrix antarctica, Strain L6-D1" /LENGTH=341 /DNA_ID=CAMNT_0038923027 /DNA_START=89 /DNA_END=1111 /DNA_ORIENTATION=-